MKSKNLQSKPKTCAFCVSRYWQTMNEVSVYNVRVLDLRCVADRLHSGVYVSNECTYEFSFYFASSHIACFKSLLYANMVVEVVFGLNQWSKCSYLHFSFSHHSCCFCFELKLLIGILPVVRRCSKFVIYEYLHVCICVHMFLSFFSSFKRLNLFFHFVPKYSNDRSESRRQSEAKKTEHIICSTTAIFTTT